VRNGADTLEVEGQGLEGLEIEGAVLEELPVIEAGATASSASASLYRRQLTALKNVRGSKISIPRMPSIATMSQASSTLELLPSTRIQLGSSARLSGVMSRMMRVFPKIAIRVLGVLSDAAGPFIYTAIMGVKLSQDIGRWIEEESYEHGINTVDDILSYIFPMIDLPRTAPTNALARIHEIKTRLISVILAEPTSSIEGLNALLDLPLIDSDPNLGQGHARYEYPDGSVLYRLSYNKTDFQGQNTTQAASFDQMLMGETHNGRLDFYVIARKTEDQGEVILASGTLLSILTAELEKVEKKYKNIVLYTKAINTLYTKYLYVSPITEVSREFARRKIAKLT
ncbi:MAG: hypothetical protein ACPGEF_08160, partial [Endozoicomonas sp.]